MYRFSVSTWAAWAPGLESQSDWARWLQSPWALPEEASPALREMPALMRRRAELLGRIALQVAYWCQSQARVDAVIWASRYGEIDRSLALLDNVACNEPMSPTAFSMSVHNAVGALYSIAQGNVGNYLAVAAGDDTIPAAFCEAAGLLADGAQQVLLIAYDAPLPERYAHFDTKVGFPRAWACCLAQAPAGGFSLARDETAASVGGLPDDLAALRFLTTDDAMLVQNGWRWQRHA
ncbi:beta-ketoacyl synthase chain length factor [Chitinolyticbacter meiyuanensis]|uniref:beta-ketoacyl synthase chain length factor n=1 Tax=Chitinolyticbacter meiyuanensis TaxID=682798 RepID=UPI0011E60112|nr:beta-ketoacyl synthase chain length factor [Chitinolyticbacter meiyuanensis]